jgi:hypothetical protein
MTINHFVNKFRNIFCCKECKCKFLLQRAWVRIWPEVWGQLIFLPRRRILSCVSITLLSLVCLIDYWILQCQHISLTQMALVSWTMIRLKLSAQLYFQELYKIFRALFSFISKFSSKIYSSLESQHKKTV